MKNAAGLGNTQTTFYKLAEEHYGVTSTNFNRDLGKDVHDYLVVPTATMATSAVEIQRFSEMGSLMQ